MKPANVLFFNFFIAGQKLRKKSSALKYIKNTHSRICCLEFFPIARQQQQALFPLVPQKQPEDDISDYALRLVATEINKQSVKTV